MSFLLSAQQGRCGLDQAVIDFQHVYESQKEREYAPIATIKVSNGDELALAWRHTNSAETMDVIHRIHDGTTEQPGLRCGKCRSFMKHYAKLQFAENVRPFGESDVDIYEELTNSFQRDHEGIPFILTGTIDGDAYLRDPYKHYKPYIHSTDNHYHINPSEVSSFRADLDRRDYDEYFNKHLLRMTKILEAHAQQPGIVLEAHAQQPGIVESLTWLSETLPQIDYGDILLPSANWFLKAMKKWLALPENIKYWEKSMVAAEALLNAPLRRGHHHEGVINTNLDMLKDYTLEALKCRQDRPALAEFLQRRLSPENYSRPPTPPTEEQIAEVVKSFKELNFTNSLMLLEDVEKYGGAIVHGDHQDNRTIATTHSVVQGDTKNRRKAVWDSGPIAYPPSTFNALKTIVEKGYADGLEVNTKGQAPVLLAEFQEAGIKALKNPTIYDGEARELSCYGIKTGWVPVSAVVIVDDGCFVAVRDAKATEPVRYRCDPSRLLPAYWSRLRGTLWGLRSREMTIPTGDRALAVGISWRETLETFYPGYTGYKGLTFCLRGKEFTINKFKKRPR